MYKTVHLKKGKEESLGRFHPWVFSGAIHHIDGRPEEGDVVRVLSADGKFLAVGHIQIGSIAVRVLSFDDITIDRSFWKQRLSAAFGVRKSIFPQWTNENGKLTNAFRLIHGEGDGLPGLVIDVYDRTAVMQAHSVGMHVSRHEIADALSEVMEGVIDNIYYKSENTLAYKASEDGGNGFLKGGLSTASDIATENGLKFHVDWLGGQKTGFFVDQRENRALLEHYAQGRKVLNMFCYTGGFSFYAMRGGAELVHSVDSSSRAIDITRANVELNFPGDARHEAYAEDALKKKVTKLEKIVDKSKNNRAILSEYFAFFDEIMHLGYGHSMEVELPNGEKVTRFIPASKEEVDGFTQSDGYVRMVLDFARNPESLGVMIDQTFDPEHRDEVLDWLKNK